jgi:hypothetical protein
VVLAELARTIRLIAPGAGYISSWLVGVDRARD